MKWKQLLSLQHCERVDLVLLEANSGKSMTEAAISLGISKQQLYQIAKREKIVFLKNFQFEKNFKKD